LLLSHLDHPQCLDALHCIHKAGLAVCIARRLHHGFGGRLPFPPFGALILYQQVISMYWSAKQIGEVFPH
jgi:hypothetical protein